MSTTTTNYNLVKPALTDAPPDITAMNPNWDTIDAQLKSLNDSVNAIPSVTVDSALSSSSTNPVQNKVVNSALSGKAPTSHASSATTYGIGTSSNYGHVKLSDSTSSTSAASAGIAASPKAVKAAYDLANSAKSGLSSYLPLSGGTVTGTTVFSKVQDSDGDSYTAPAVVIGGAPTTYHLELDNNEIQAKQNETTPGNLFLNSNGGVVHVGLGGLKMDSESSIIPEYALSSSVGTADFPFNHIYGRYFNLYGAAGTQYGRFRVGTTGTTSTEGTVALELGNSTATGTAHNASGKITMYGSGTAFTNILPSTATSGSNSVRLPAGSGTLALEGSGAKIAVGSYTGTKTSGSSNPCSITFDFVPRIVMIAPATTGSYDFAIFYSVKIPSGSYAKYGWASSLSGNEVSWQPNGYAKLDGTTLYWYYDTTSGQNSQLNAAKVYNYVAIG